MQQFSIKDMERLSGIKAHTLRIWEQRYGILQPLRKEGNHRFYSNEDLKSLLRVVYLYAKGHRIGEIARLSQEEIRQLLLAAKPNETSARANILAMIEAILDFDEEALEKIFHRITRQFGFAGAMLEVVFPLLNNLGQLWMSDRLSPGQEHFASNFFLRKMLYEQNEMEQRPVKKPGLILLFTPRGEFHEIGLLFMNHLLQQNGYSTVYIGSNASLETVEQFCAKCRPSHVYLYLTGNLQDEDPEVYLQMLANRLKDIRVVAGGRVAADLPDIAGCKLLRNKDEMLQFSKDIYLQT